MKLSWRNGGLVLEPETSKESSALIRLTEALVLLEVAQMRRDPVNKPPSTDGGRE